MSSRIALITGSSRGIGRAIAHRLASDGLDLAISDLSTLSGGLTAVRDELANKYPNQRFLAITGDITSEDDVRQIFEEVINTFGCLDVLVANAGLCQSLKPLIETSAEDVDKLFSVNVKGTILCFQYAARQMIKQGRGGRIIGASSQAGKQGSPMLAAYSASKFAVRGLTQATAAELGPYGITVNSYAPGAVITDMTLALPRGAGLDVDKFFAEQANIPPLRRNGEPEDIAGLVSFLASEQSSYMTGQTVTIDGGRYFD